MHLTMSHLSRTAHGVIGHDNAASFLAGLEAIGPRAGLDRPHRVVHLVAQAMHESLAFTFDREIWGPTKAQLRYEGRADLGNTRPGDGYRYRGRGPFQVTGRANYARFTAWCRGQWPDCPDFEADPDALLTGQWEGLSPIWYWDAGNPTGRSLNRYADEADAEMVTRRINGGLNGYRDRLDYLARASLVLLDRDPDDVRGFQRDTRGLAVDGIAGPRTREALHQALRRLS